MSQSTLTKNRNFSQIQKVHFHKVFSLQSLSSFFFSTENLKPIYFSILLPDLSLPELSWLHSLYFCLFSMYHHHLQITIPGWMFANISFIVIVNDSESHSLEEPHSPTGTPYWPYFIWMLLPFEKSRAQMKHISPYSHQCILIRRPSFHNMSYAFSTSKNTAITQSFFNLGFPHLPLWTYYWVTNTSSFSETW